MTTTLFGISNCDTIKKARKWLNEKDIHYVFHDYRKEGIDKNWLEETEKRLGWEQMLNKRGTTFRQLDDAQKANLDKDSALELMLKQPAMIKRPILIDNGNYALGFKPQDYTEFFAK
ncbi:ArsC family reductase [Alteromonas pelagimontana]|uniref:ArsC family reductase n=1 Tax=Alteromonas pelagimontana TaxID=1858656 RepID=A0A6M4MA26_9ALTE|nr:ArsC family reductase [Alteromonas pelagimontana]QJR79668.1 ArsC family reductase [Alteromonas pelagimontana]